MPRNYPSIPCFAWKWKANGLDGIGFFDGTDRESRKRGRFNDPAWSFDNYPCLPTIAPAALFHFVSSCGGRGNVIISEWSGRPEYDRFLCFSCDNRLRCHPALQCGLRGFVCSAPRWGVENFLESGFELSNAYGRTGPCSLRWGPRRIDWLHARRPVTLQEKATCLLPLSRSPDSTSAWAVFLNRKKERVRAPEKDQLE